jgi:hypothetical protein
MTRKFKAGIFSDKEYKRSNQWGIDRVAEYLVNKGYSIVEKEEDYDVDITAVKNGKIYLFEAEVKRGYPFTSVEDFKFPTVSFLGRKKKYHKKHESGFHYCVVCFETGCIISCHSSDIYIEEQRQLKTISKENRKKGLDEFYLVPKEKCTFTQKKES